MVVLWSARFWCLVCRPDVWVANRLLCAQCDRLCCRPDVWVAYRLIGRPTGCLYIPSPRRVANLLLCPPTGRLACPSPPVMRDQSPAPARRVSDPVPVSARPSCSRVAPSCVPPCPRHPLKPRPVGFFRPWHGFCRCGFGRIGIPLLSAISALFLPRSSVRSAVSAVCPSAVL